ncbi:uncharacterized acetyltransferase At3g50280-like isoform X1 [Nicotiana tomentosiformis]|uniref:uncharacterized acetyltransferase At3g50280-like isoform X1 n=1 Tax=Nicotiana tomentosiformis TaxID=4098 RepID=UPI00051B08A9|nr:uncharacterized acetyltransferase At3g50280-like [Nicotiana tomentosiformis]
MEEVQVISTCLVGAASKLSSSNNNGNNTTISQIEMTPWDLQFLLVDTIQKGLLFRKPTPQQENTLFKSLSSLSLIDHLKTSLSRTLDFFPPLAGRFSTTKNANDDTISFFITCNNAGVEFTHAIAPELTVEEILESCYVPPIVHSLFPLNKMRNIECVTKPLLGIQVTELVNGYFIGCTMSHSVGDGTCFWNFFNSWSEISSGSEFISRLPVLKRWFPENIKPPIHLPLNLEDQELYECMELPPLKERIFHLSKESIGKLKAKANSEMGTNSISSLQAFLAHLWKSVTRCRQLDSKEEVTISIVVGTRPRLNPPLAEGYWGNAAYFKPVKRTAGELLEKGLGWAALQMNKIIASQNNEEVVKLYKEWVEKPVLFTKGSLFVANRLTISSSPKFSVYSTDFGWGKAVAVRSGMANKGDGKVTLFPGAEEGSVDIEVCLLPETLLAMENDEEFMKAVTV